MAARALTAPTSPASSETDDLARVRDGARRLRRKVRGRYESEGRRLLCVVKAKTKLVVMAHVLECSEGHVSQLLNGLREPSTETIARIFFVFGIRGETWGMAPALHPVNIESSTSTVAEGKVDPSPPRSAAAE